MSAIVNSHCDTSSSTDGPCRMHHEFMFQSVMRFMTLNECAIAVQVNHMWHKAAIKMRRNESDGFKLKLKWKDEHSFESLLASLPASRSLTHQITCLDAFDDKYSINVADIEHLHQCMPSLIDLSARLSVSYQPSDHVLKLPHHLHRLKNLIQMAPTEQDTNEICLNMVNFIQWCSCIESIKGIECRYW